MPVNGNLETLTAVEADLVARFPALEALRPEELYTWSVQLAAGKAMALRRFREARPNMLLGAFGQVTTEPIDASRAKARDDEDWTNIIALYTLSIILTGNVNTELVARGVAFAEQADTEIAAFLFDYDVDDDGEIDLDTQEEGQSFRSIQLVRG